MPTAKGFLALRDRAFQLVSASGPVAEEALVAYVFGGHPPAGVREHLLKPLLDDARLARAADGTWSIATRPSDVVLTRATPFTALALAATGPRPTRARVLALDALHVEAGATRARFSARLNPGLRVPRYAAERAAVDADGLSELPSLDTMLDDFLLFLGARPIVGQEVRFGWSFVEAEARRAGRNVVQPPLIDINRLAERVLALRGKPTLAAIAQALGLSFGRIEHAHEEARIVALVTPRLVACASDQGFPVVEQGTEEPTPAALRRTSTAREAPNRPGVYVMRDAQQTPLYVGKARRLRERLADYVHRPLGPTRRLEGLADEVEAVESHECGSDLEALILEDREIRRLVPRFNTVRQQRAPRTWLRRPPQPQRRPGKRQLAPARLELARGPDAGDGDFLGPFCNETAAAHARALARTVFGLDAARRESLERYVELMDAAWAFLRGDTAQAVLEARRQHARAVADRNDAAARTWARVLASVLAYDPAELLLPADPRTATYVVLRPGPTGLEAFVIDRGILRASDVLHAFDDLEGCLQRLLATDMPRTQASDVDVVLRWFGAQRPPARRILVDRTQPISLRPLLAAAEAIFNAQESESPDA